MKTTDDNGFLFGEATINLPLPPTKQPTKQTQQAKTKKTT